MIQDSHRFGKMIANAVCGFANLFASLLDHFSNASGGKTLLMIPVRRGRHGGTSVSVRFQAQRRNCPSLRPWPLCRIDRD